LEVVTFDSSEAPAKPLGRVVGPPDLACVGCDDWRWRAKQLVSS
jgi:hypothetical protein